MIFDTKLTCPKCGCESPMKNFQLLEEWQKYARLAAQFGKQWPWVSEYLECFQSDYNKPLKIRKANALLEELLKFVEQKGFNIEKQWHAIRPDALFAAVREVALKNKVGFKNHNYLKRVAIDVNLKMIQGEEKVQRQREDQALKRDPNAPQKLRQIMAGLGTED